VEALLSGKMVSMNLIPVASVNKLSLHVLIERVESGIFMASVPELADCVAKAETRSAAIADVQENVRGRPRP
jgi:hypothetical protein